MKFLLLAALTAIVILAHTAASDGASAQTPPAPQRGVGTRVDTSNQSVPTKYFALVIGNNDYLFQPKLQTAVNDAEEIARTLQRDFGFETKLLVNANRSQILKALNEYRKTLDDNSSLLIYYAGHGFRDKENDLTYWLPVDAEVDDTSQWITATDINSTIKIMAARHVLIVSDSCYAGGLAREAVSGRDREVSLQKMAQNSSRSLMASGSLEPVSDSGGSGHSIFAKAFLTGLESGNQSAFAASALFQEYVYPLVSGRSSQTPVYTTIRNAGVDRGDFVFVRHGAVPSSGNVVAAAVPSAPKPAPPAEPTHYAAPAADAMTLENALAVLERAQKMLPNGDVGQVLAVESMVNTRHSLSGTDLAGLSLKGGHIGSGDFSKALMFDMNLQQVQAATADLSQADLAFSSLDQAHFENAVLTSAKLDFASIDHGQFQNAKAAAVRGFSISAHETDFGHADLSGARFMFGDFRGANFDNANLAGAFFVGSDLTGASFQGAILDNTDFSGSAMDGVILTAQQKSGACQVLGASKIFGVNVLIIDDIPSSQFSGGQEHKRWVETLFGSESRPLDFAACHPRQLEDSWWYPIYSARGKEFFTDSYARGFPDSFVSRRGSEIQDRIKERHKWLQTDMNAKCLTYCATTGHCTCN